MALKHAVLVWIIGFVAVAGAGCKSSQGPQRPFKLYEVKHLKYDYASPTNENYFRVRYENATDKEVVRNDIIQEVMGVIDSNYNYYEWALRTDKTVKDSIIDLVALGLTTAATAVGGEAVKTVLSGIAAGTIGANALVDKHVFREQTLQAIQLQMQAQRKAQEAKIYQRMKDSAEVYAMTEAQRDLEDYFFAGSVTKALQALLTQSQQARAAAETNLNDVKIDFRTFKGRPSTAVPQKPKSP